MTSTLPVLSNECTEKLIVEGSTSKAPPPSIGEAKQTPELRQREGGGLIGWYNAQMPLIQDLQGRGYKDEGNGRMSSPYSETGRDVTLLEDEEGVQSAYLHSSSHPMAQCRGQDGESLSKHRLKRFEFCVYYEHSDGGKVPYEEAFKAALRSIAKIRDIELAEEQLRQAGELPGDKPLDVSEIPEPTQRKGDKLDFTDEQAVIILGLALHLAAPDDDVSFAVRFAQLVRERVCFVAGRGWMAYDEAAHIWVGGERALMIAERYAKQLPQVLSDEVTRLLRYAIALNKADRDQARAAMLRLVDRMTIAKGKKGIGSRTARLRAIDDAKELLEADGKLFEAKQYVLGFPNGVWDNGIFREHRREDGITELLPVEYDPQTDQTDCLSVLERMTGGDQAFQSDLQYAVGYGLSGLSNQRLLFWLHGPKGTGKSLFIETMLAAAGNLGVTVSPELLAVGSKRGAFGASIYNKRIVVLPEVGGTRRLESEIVKTMSSGGDSIAVEFKYKDAFTARPTHATFASSNEAPNIDPNDDALWERIKALPFLHPLASDGKEDLLGGKHLQDVMRDPESAYLRGFLAWAMEGLERVRSKELFKASERVVKASAATRKESDPYLEFWPWLISNADESNGEMPVLQRLLEGVTANWLKGQLEYWCDSNAIHFPRGRALKAVYEAVGLAKRASSQKWVLEHPERFPR